MADPADTLAQTIAALRVDYAAKLPGRVAEIEDLWRRLDAGAAAPAQLDDLLRMIHGVAGSGATFGLEAASKAARELEAFLESKRAHGGPAGAAENERGAALIAALKDAAG